MAAGLPEKVDEMKASKIWYGVARHGCNGRVVRGSTRQRRGQAGVGSRVAESVSRAAGCLPHSRGSCAASGG